jgi:hypothetical protein
MRPLMKLYISHYLWRLNLSVKSVSVFIKNFIMFIFIISFAPLLLSCASSGSSWELPVKNLSNYSPIISKTPLHAGLNLSLVQNQSMNVVEGWYNIQVGENLSKNAEKVARQYFSDVSIVNDIGVVQENLDIMLAPKVDSYSDNIANGSAFYRQTDLVLNWTLKNNKETVILWERIVRGKATGPAGNIYTGKSNTNQRIESAITEAFKKSFELISTDGLDEIIKLHHNNPEMWDFQGKDEQYFISSIPTLLTETKNKYYYSKLLERSLIQNWNNLLKLLIVNNISLDVQFGADGYYPLHVAAMNNNIEAIDILVSAGCKVNIKDDNGHLPIFYADNNNYFDTVKKIIALKSDVEISEKADDILTGKYYMELGDYCASIHREETTKECYNHSNTYFKKASKQYGRMLFVKSFWGQMLIAMAQAAVEAGNEYIAESNQKQLDQITALKMAADTGGDYFRILNSIKKQTPIVTKTSFSRTIPGEKESVSENAKELIKQLKNEADHNLEIITTKLTSLESPKN